MRATFSVPMFKCWPHGAEAVALVRPTEVQPGEFAAALGATLSAGGGLTVYDTGYNLDHAARIIYLAPPADAAEFISLLQRISQRRPLYHWVPFTGILRRVKERRSMLSKLDGLARCALVVERDAPEWVRVSSMVHSVDALAAAISATAQTLKISLPQNDEKMTFESTLHGKAKR